MDFGFKLYKEFIYNLDSLKIFLDLKKVNKI